MCCVGRRARAQEAGVIADLWLASRHAAPGMPPSAHSDDDVRVWIRELLMPSCEVWVATECDVAVGMLALKAHRIEQLYVAPASQRRGHGSRLLAVVQGSRASLELWTFESNLGARRFYEAHGFRWEGTSSSDNEERVPALLYRW
ncbi:GNAT family N-acetyltransferase [Conexibacter sp. S30A1]|uniref:GNAT family N-acetyltransferase n=1 Tax=Conexibacter sp. S30A1 TaxID=2937800 RepID=UPI00200BB6A1|nr:GNAT family N-acetyltransferase [Conexibacter sp. S30A1]